MPDIGGKDCKQHDGDQRKVVEPPLRIERESQYRQRRYASQPVGAARDLYQVRDNDDEAHVDAQRGKREVVALEPQ
ncbi:hypothetical protein D3C86_1794020 [compost metagenome]